MGATSYTWSLSRPLSITCRSVALILNPRTGHVSPQFHVVFDDNFTTVPYMNKNQVPPNWANLVESSREDVTVEQYDLANTWLASTLEQNSEHHQSAQDNIGDTVNGSSSLIATNNACPSDNRSIGIPVILSPCLLSIMST